MNDSRKLRHVPGVIRGALVVGIFGALVWFELRRPLRQPVQSKLLRNARNLAVAGTAALALQLAEAPVANPLSRTIVTRRIGILQCARLPLWAEVGAAVLLMDYTLYLWHVLTHVVPFLWRFHQPHHIDLDLDASTAIRFHFGELALSTIWRAAQIAAIGVSPLSLSVWQMFVFGCILFHHSNVRLPQRLERSIGVVLVTPRMHGIHHSMVRDQTNSNWSSGLTIWDWLHGTLRLDVPQSEIRIGVPAYSNPGDVTLPKVLALPFEPQRPSWELPA